MLIEQPPYLYRMLYPETIWRIPVPGKEKNIYYISSKMMLGSDREATVDGIHFTDVGMMRYADLVTPVIKKLLKK